MTFIIHKKKKNVYKQFARVVYFTPIVSFSFRIFKNLTSFYATRDIFFSFSGFLSFGRSEKIVIINCTNDTSKEQHSSNNDILTTQIFTRCSVIKGHSKQLNSSCVWLVCCRKIKIANSGSQILILKNNLNSFSVL